MNMLMLQSYIEGYQDRLFDFECLAVQNGYWAGYYQSKRPKPANQIIQKMISDREKAVRKRKKKNTKKPEVDVEKFLQLEAKRAEFLARKQQRK